MRHESHDQDNMPINIMINLAKILEYHHTKTII